MITFKDSKGASMLLIETTRNIDSIEKLEQLIRENLNSVDFDLYNEGSNINVLDIQLSRGEVDSIRLGIQYYYNTYQIFYEMKTKQIKTII